MIFQIDENKKSLMQKTIGLDKKSVRIIKKIEKGLLILGLVGGGLYALLNCLLPGWSIYEIEGVVKKDYEWIIGMTLTIMFPCFIFSWGLKALAFNLGSSDYGNRTDENILLENNILNYTFRFLYQSKEGDRNVITIPLDKIEEVYYSQKANSLLLKGTFISDYVENYDLNNTSSGTEEEIDEILLFDYFKPSLLETLRESGIKVEVE